MSLGFQGGNPGVRDELAEYWIWPFEVITIIFRTIAAYLSALYLQVSRFPEYEMDFMLPRLFISTVLNWP